MLRLSLLSRTSLTLNQYTLLKSQYRNINVFAEFAASVKRQVAENRDFQQNVKSLGDETTRLADSDAVQRAKLAMQKGASTTGVVMNHVKDAASSVGDAVERTLETPAIKSTIAGVNYVATKTADVVEAIAEPILDTEAAKQIGKGVKIIKKEIIDTSTTGRYSEYKPKHIRDAERLEKEADMLRSDPLKKLGKQKANLNAGEALVLHKKSKFDEKWDSYKEQSIIFKSVNSVKQSIKDSENPTVEKWRDYFSTWGDETEQAKIIRMFKEQDGGFSIEKFVKTATEDYLPEIMEAYLKGDMPTLKLWCSEQLCAQFGAGIATQSSQGYISHCSLLDIRKVELQSTKQVDDIPFIFLDFNTQETLLFKNKKGEIVLGKEDRIEHVRYRAVFTMDAFIEKSKDVEETEESEDDSEEIKAKRAEKLQLEEDRLSLTGGWKCQECIRIDSWEGF